MMTNQVTKRSDSKTTYGPDLYIREEIAELPWVFKNKTGEAFVLAVNKGPMGTYLKGFVESESRKGMYHYVVELVDRRMTVVNGGFCECESRHYYGRPCKHVTHLKNVYLKNRDELDKLASYYPDIRR